MIFYIGAGSNQGNGLQNLLQARALLEKELLLLGTAPLLENPPLLPPEAPESWYSPFLNTAFRVEWNKSPEELLTVLKNIELQLGRRPEDKRWAPRTMDLDILRGETELKKEFTFESTKIAIPHLEVHNRRFTLNPLTHLQAQAPFKNATPLVHLRKNGLTVPYVMAILNCTPDSFADGSQETSLSLQQRLQKFLDLQVPYIDIGAESTRPGATPVTVEQEWTRLQPLLEYWKSVSSQYPFTTVSIDTRHSETAEKALGHNVTMLNDVSHLSQPAMREIAQHFDHIVFMHSLSIPADRQLHMDNNVNPLQELIRWSEEKLDALHHIPLHKLIFDPGIGFGKTPYQSLQILQNLKQFENLPVRLLVGHSRKSFMNLWTKTANSDRDPETIGASLAMAHQSPVNILRVHNPELHLRALSAFYTTESLQ
jgi:2-amino-4-hydroxy-6-hydroxymethyldihydropteridine diphosphokinase / dihydropteroate synthase